MFHGARTYILQSPAGQITESYSIGAGLDYPGVGPEHAWLKDSSRVEYVVATDEEALRGFRMCTQLEGIIPGAFNVVYIYSIQNIDPFIATIQPWSLRMLFGRLSALRERCLRTRISYL